MNPCGTPIFIHSPYYSKVSVYYSKIQNGPIIPNPAPPSNSLLTCSQQIKPGQLSSTYPII